MPKGTEVYDDFSPKMHILRFLRADEHPILVKNTFFVDFVYFLHFFRKLSSQEYEHLGSREILLTTKNSIF